MNNFDTHILVVDDDEEIRELVKEYLDQNDHTAVLMENGCDVQLLNLKFPVKQ